MPKSFWFLSWLLFTLPAHAALRNVTIDDTVPDPLTGTSIIYDPAERWNSGADCVQCSAQLSESQVFNGTWHDTTFYVQPGSSPFPNTPLYATAAFTGTAVYVICILARMTSTPFGNSDMSFFLDGNLVGNFSKSAPGTPGYDYNVTVYANTSIPSGFHTLRIQNGHINGSNSIILLDRIVYTTDIKETHSSSSTGIIAGSVVGAVLGVTALAVAAFFLIRYRRGLDRTSLLPSTRGILGLNRRDLNSDQFIPFLDSQPNPNLPNGRYTVTSNTKAEHIYMRTLPNNISESGSSQPSNSQLRYMHSSFNSSIPQPSSAGSVWPANEAPPVYHGR